MKISISVDAGGKSCIENFENMTYSKFMCT